MSGSSDALPLRITPAEKAEILASADAEGLSPEEAARQIVVEAMRQRLNGNRRRYTGNVFQLPERKP